jgi:hypothetical protein
MNESLCPRDSAARPGFVWRCVTMSGALVAAWLMSRSGAATAWAAAPQVHRANNRRSRTALGLASLTKGWR